MNRPVIYVVIAQESCTKEFEKLFRGSTIVYVYARNVEVDTGYVKGNYHLFSFQKLPKKILSPHLYDQVCKEQTTMIHSTMDDLNNEFVIWAFPLDTAYVGIYVSILLSLKKREKKLRFHLSPLEMERIYKDPLFHDLSKHYVDAGTILNLQEYSMS